jgi:hypothetical protein
MAQVELIESETGVSMYFAVLKAWRLTDGNTIENFPAVPSPIMKTGCIPFKKPVLL